MQHFYGFKSLQRKLRECICGEVHQYQSLGKPKKPRGNSGNEVSDEIHGQYHSADIVKRMHGHGDQALEWWALYIKKEEFSL